MVSNTVTSVMSVVEEKLLSIEQAKQQPVVHEKLELVKVKPSFFQAHLYISLQSNLRDLDIQSPEPPSVGEDLLSPRLDPLAGPAYNPLNEVRRLAGEIGSSIETAEAMARDGERPTVEAAKNLLKDQRKTIEHMFSIANKQPGLHNFPSFMETIVSFQSPRKSMLSASLLTRTKG